MVLETGAREFGCAQVGNGAGSGISFARFRRFWTVAARRNSSRAPKGSLSLRRSRFRMRLRCEQHLDPSVRAAMSHRPPSGLRIIMLPGRAESRSAPAHRKNRSETHRVPSSRRGRPGSVRCPCPEHPSLAESISPREGYTLKCLAETGALQEDPA